MSESAALAGLQPWLDRCTFAPLDQPLRIGVSGGGDSLALLALACSRDRAVTAVHVDHGQRSRPNDERERVAAAAHAVGAEFESADVHVDPGPNLEARMRWARYSVLGPDAATGHTADDQAETMLINMIRGSGLRGLGAMQPGHRRPILGLRRFETEAICERMGWAPFVDPTNSDRRFTRNRLRGELIPLLNDIADRDVVPLLCRAAAHIRSAGAYIESAAARVDATDARALADAPDAVAAAAVSMWVRDATDAEHPIDAAAVERVLAVASGDRVAAEVAGGWRVSRSGQRLSIS